MFEADNELTIKKTYFMVIGALLECIHMNLNNKLYREYSIRELTEWQQTIDAAIEPKSE